MNHLAVIICAIVMLPGIVGVFLPIIPGLVYMFIVAIIFAALDHFTHVTGTNLLILACIAAVSFIVDHASGILGARLSGASAKASVAGLVGSIIGLFVFPPFGSIIGLFVGVIIIELGQHGDQKRALRAASGSLLGSLAGMIANLIIALIFIITFITLAWR